MLGLLLKADSIGRCMSCSLRKRRCKENPEIRNLKRKLESDRNK